MGVWMNEFTICLMSISNFIYVIDWKTELQKEKFREKFFLIILLEYQCNNYFLAITLKHSCSIPTPIKKKKGPVKFNSLKLNTSV